MCMGVVDISGAFMQIGSIRWEWHGTARGRIFKLLKVPYGMTEAGRQFPTVIEDWLINTMNVDTVPVIYPLFLKRMEDGSIRMILSKVTYGIILAGRYRTWIIL